MAKHSLGTSCERARAWAALAPDGELSMLERKLLDSHVQRCATCSDFAVQVAAVAAGLRTAALEPLPQPVSTPTRWRRSPVYGRVRTVAAGAAVAAMALGIASRAPLATTERDSFALPRITNFSENLQREATQLRALRVAARPGAKGLPSSRNLAV
jgi:hypothetical protein